jgi:hypothetical protein
MAQQVIYENDLQSTVNFSAVNAGEIFIYGGLPCLRISGTQNPNYAAIGLDEKGKLEDTDQVLLPNKAIIKVE